MNLENIMTKLSDIEIVDEDTKIDNEEKTINKNMINVYCEFISKNKKQKGLMFSKKDLDLEELKKWIDRNCRSRISKEVLSDKSIRVVYDNYEEIYTLKEDTSNYFLQASTCNKVRDMEVETLTKSYMKKVYHLLENEMDIVTLNILGAHNYNTVLKGAENNFNLLIYVRDDIDNIKFQVGNQNIEISSIKKFLNNLKLMDIVAVESLFTKFRIINPKYRETLKPLYLNKNIILEKNLVQYFNSIIKMIELDFNKLDYTKLNEEYTLEIIEIIRLLNHIFNINRNGIDNSFDESSRKSYYARIKKQAFSNEQLVNSLSKVRSKFNKVKNYYAEKSPVYKFEIIDSVLKDF